jgi:hypothetical protein
MAQAVDQVLEVLALVGEAQVPGVDHQQRRAGVVVVLL